MHRKNFIHLSGTLVAGAVLPLKKSFVEREDEEESNIKKPAYLKVGDIIGITAPAGAIKQEEIQPAVSLMESWGYTMKIGDTIGKEDFTFGGTDEERLQDLQQMLDDPSVKAIMCARGGYGCIRIVDRLQWNKFKRKPKWVIGL